MNKFQLIREHYRFTPGNIHQKSQERIKGKYFCHENTHVEHTSQLIRTLKIFS